MSTNTEWELEKALAESAAELAKAQDRVSEILHTESFRQPHRTAGCWHATTSFDTARIWCVDCGLTRFRTATQADKAALVQAVGKILAEQNVGVKVNSPPRSDPRTVAMEGFCD